MTREFYRRERGEVRILPGRRFVLRLIMDELGRALFLHWNEVYDRRRIFHYPFHRPTSSRHLLSTESESGNTKRNSTIHFIVPHKIFLAYHHFAKYGTSISDNSLL